MFAIDCKKNNASKTMELNQKSILIYRFLNDMLQELRVSTCNTQITALSASTAVLLQRL